MDFVKLKQVLADVSADSFGDFVTILSEFHTKIQNIIDIHEALADDNPQARDEFLLRLIGAFEEGELPELLSVLDQAYEGADITLDDLNPFANKVEEFVGGYGVSEFLAQDFTNIIDNVNSLEEAGQDEVRVDEPLGPEPLGPEPAITVDDLLSGQVRKSRGGEAQPSEEEGDPEEEEPISQKKVKILERLTVEENVILNLDVSGTFFSKRINKEDYRLSLAAARQSSQDLDELNFHDAFSGLPALYAIDDEQHKIIFDLNAANLAEKAAIDFIALLNREYSRLSGENISYSKIHILQVKRKKLAEKLDDFVAAIKIRDLKIKDLLSKFHHMGYAMEGYNEIKFSLTKLIKDPNTALSKELNNLIMNVVFIDIRSEIVKYKFSRAAKANKALLEEVMQAFTPIFEERLLQAIVSFFSPSIALNSEVIFDQEQFSQVSRTNEFSIAAFLSSHGSLGRQLVQQFAYEQTVMSKKRGWSYMSCPTCNKEIYTAPFTGSYKGSGRGAEIHPREHSDYEEERYSLLRKDGTIITLDQLNQHGEFPPPEGYLEGATWLEIESMVASPRRSKHIEGVARRSLALSAMGGIPVHSSKQGGYIANYKYLCPYGDTSAPRAGLETMQAGKPARFQCGLSLDPTPLLSGDQNIRPEHLQATGASLGYSIEQYSATLDEVAQSGTISEEQKQDFLDELNRRRGGGWKFSNTYFRCPCKVDIPEEHYGKENFDISDYERYSYIASPISGPITEAAVASNDVYLPRSADGSIAPIQEGSMSYLVCGALTSLSAFIRSPSDLNSLSAILTELISKASSGPDGLAANKVLADLINTLIYLGVDVSDILPLMSRNVRVAADMFEAERFKKIAHLFAAAMASPQNLSGLSKITESSTVDIIKNIGLRCKYGHNFTVGDSVFFGRTHTGINMQNVKKNVYSWRDVIDSGILFSEGLENFKNTLKLRTAGKGQGNPYILQGNRSGSSPTDYEGWSGRSIYDIYFLHPETGAELAFHHPSRTYIWGSEDGKPYTSARVREIRDRDSVIETHLNSRKDIEGGREDGAQAGADKMGRAAAQAGAADSTVSNIMEMAKDSLGKLSTPASPNKGVNQLTVPLGSMLKSYLTCVHDWLDLATSLDAEGVIAGKSEVLGTDEEKMAKLLDESRNVMLSVIEYAEGEITPFANTVIDMSLQRFKESYLNRVFKLDLRFLNQFGLINTENIIHNIIYSMLNTLYDARKNENLGADEKSGAKEWYANYRGDLLLSNMQINFNTLVDAGVDLNSLTDNFREILAPTALTAREIEGIYSPISEEGYSLKVTKMKGKEFMGMIMLASSALYIADSISRIYNLYMKYPNTSNYIGYDIGLDLSSIDKVLALDKESVERINIGFDNLELEGSPHYNPIEFIEDYFDNILNCIKALEGDLVRVKAACVSYKYIQRASDIIRERLNNIIVSEPESEESIKASRIINSVMVNLPVTTIDLNSGGKYANYYSSSAEAGGVPHGLIPLFGAMLVTHKDKQLANVYYPVYILTTVKGVHHNFNIDIPLPASKKYMYVLSSKALPGSNELADISNTLPEVYKDNGWAAYEVLASEWNFKDSRSNAGLSEGVSYIYHPGTIQNFDENNNVSSYSNIESGLDTSLGMFLGSLCPKEGRGLCFPPVPLMPNNIGVPIPFGYVDRMKEPATRKAAFPILDVRIPVPIKIGDYIENIDVSDFLLREPHEVALSLIKEIMKNYKLYQKDLSSINIRTPEGRKQEERVKAQYKEIISKLNYMYRSLPFATENKRSATARARQNIAQFEEGTQHSERFGARASVYMPMIDWVIMHKMITSPAFGPEFGGHNLWSVSEGSAEGDTEVAIRAVKSGLERFLIELNGLERLAELLSARLNIDISPEDLLDPQKRLFNSGKITKKQCKELFGYDFSYTDTSVESSVMMGAHEDEFGSELFWIRSNTGEALEEVQVVSDSEISKAGTTNIFRNFRSWAMSPGRYYPIGVERNVSSRTGDPAARIKILNTIFPSQDYASRLADVQDLSSEALLDIEQLYAYEVLLGNPRKQTFYPPPATDRVSHISIVRQAEAISDYLREYHQAEMTRSWDIKKLSFYKNNLIKKSKIDKMAFDVNGIMIGTRLMALWNYLTR